MAYYEDIEKIFMNDIREKKRAGTGAFHMRGKGVKHGISGALRTPYHFMSNKDKKKLNGEVEVTNMYETVITREEFDLKDRETQRNMLIRWRDLYPNEKIMSDMGITGSGTFHKYIKELDIPKKPRGGSSGGGLPKKRKSKAKTSPQISLDLEESKKEEIQEEVVKTMLITRGLHLEYNGKYDVDSLNRLFTKLQLLVDGETCKYNISLSLSEVEEE